MHTPPTDEEGSRPLRARNLRLGGHGREGWPAGDSADMLEDGSWQGGVCESPRGCGGSVRPVCLAVVAVGAVMLAVGSARAVRKPALGLIPGAMELEGEAACHTTMEGEECHTLVAWVMQMAAESGQTDWGGLGVSSHSSLEEVQEALHNSHKDSKCPPPCLLPGGSKGSEHTAESDAADHSVVGEPGAAKSAEGSSSTQAAMAASDATREKYEQDMIKAAALAFASPTPEPHAAAARHDTEVSEARGDADGLFGKLAQAVAANTPVEPGSFSKAPVAVSASECGLVQDMAYLPGNDLQTVPNVSSAGECCQACTAVEECVGWTWGRRTNASTSALPHAAHMCYLKGSRPRPVLTRIYDPDFISGWTTPSVKPLSITTEWASNGSSLLCASALAPGAEAFQEGARLLAVQYDMKASIFGCDEYMVFADDASGEVAPGVWPLQIKTSGERADSRRAGSGGEGAVERVAEVESKLSLWRTLLETGRYRFHDWTVKVDVQAVFLPGRLRKMVMGRSDELFGTYVAACESRVSQVLEVMSKNAADSLYHGWEQCLDYFLTQGSAFNSAEELLLDQCFQVLHAQRVADSGVLDSDVCGRRDAGCSKGSASAFHPYHTVETYRKCVQEAEGLLP